MLKIMEYYPIGKLNKLTAEILDMMPPLAEFFEGNEKIETYSRKLDDFQTQGIHVKRQSYFIDLIDRKINKLFNSGEKQQIKVLQDKNKGLRGGVVDHHGIINDPVLFGVNMVTEYYRMFDRKNNGDILTFATGNVPLNNPFHKRGFMIENKKVNIFNKEDKNKLVFMHPLHDFDFVNNLKINHSWHSFSKDSQYFLLKIQKMIQNIDYSGCRTLGDQFTKINFHLWPHLFSEDIRANVSNLISLEYDDVVIDFLIHTIDNDVDSFVVKMLFDDQMRNKALKHFEGTQGAWVEKRNMGTHFFWAINSKHEQSRLKLENGILKSADGELSLEWKKESLISALKDRKILPNMLLKFSLIIFYMGMRPQTGYGSANYVSIMKQNIIDYLGGDFSDELSRIENMKVNNLTTIPVVLRRNNNNIENYFAFDVMKDGGLNKEYFDKINKLPLKYFLAPALNAIYDYAFHLYGKGNHTEVQLSSDDYSELFKGII